MGQFFTVGVNISMRTSSHGDPYYLVLIKCFYRWVQAIADNSSTGIPNGKLEQLKIV